MDTHNGVSTQALSGYFGKQWESEKFAAYGYNCGSYKTFTYLNIECSETYMEWNWVSDIPGQPG